MKKIFVQFIIFLLSVSNLFSIEDSKFRKIIEDRASNGYGSRTTDYVVIYKLDDKYSVGVEDVGYNFFYLYYTDGENLYSSSARKTNESTLNIPNYIFNIPNSSELIGDFTFDESPDILNLSLAFYRGYNGYNQVSICKLENVEDIWDPGYFKLLFPGLKLQANNTENYEYTYEGKNPRVSKEFYISFNDIKFCIVNGRRGLRAYIIGKIYQEHNPWETEQEYMMNVKNGDDSSYAFFYWDKQQEKYIYDSSASQEQIKNAYSPKDYFAYNGLKFSKLDSKLTENDLKDLDKAQLRLMRNAVYARHGRTFKSVDLQSLWECYTWYEKNPNYSDDLLTETDKYNIEIIKSYENR